MLNKIRKENNFFCLCQRFFGQFCCRRFLRSLRFIFEASKTFFQIFRNLFQSFQKFVLWYLARAVQPVEVKRNCGFSITNLVINVLQEIISLNNNSMSYFKERLTINRDGCKHKKLAMLSRITLNLKVCFVKWIIKGQNFDFPTKSVSKNNCEK